MNQNHAASVPPCLMMNWLKVNDKTATKMRATNMIAAQNVQLIKIVSSGTSGASCEPAMPAKPDSMTMAISAFTAKCRCVFDSGIKILLKVFRMIAK